MLLKALEMIFHTRIPLQCEVSALLSEFMLYKYLWLLM